MILRWILLSALVATTLANQVPKKRRNTIGSRLFPREFDLDQKLREAVRSQLFKSKDDPLPDIDWELWQNFLTPLKGKISEQCRKDSQNYISKLNGNFTLIDGNSWAYKMFDASTKLPHNGLLEGNLKSVGSFDSCLEVVSPTFKGKHCTMGFTNPDPFEQMEMRQQLERQVWKYVQEHAVKKTKGPYDALAGLFMLVVFGRCIPDSCSEADLYESFKVFMTEEIPSFPVSPYVYNCHTADEVIEKTGADWAMIGIIVFFLLCILVGTLVDLSIKFLHIDSYPERFVQVFQGFSIYTNTMKLVKTDNIRPDSLTSINGIRFLSMSWVLLGHSYSAFQQNIPVTNLFVMFDAEGPVQGNLAFQAVSNAFPSVDTFFFIGATLLAYITLKELDKYKGGNLSFWIMYYVHRYIRLTAVYAMVIGVWATLLKFLATGPQSVLLDLESKACRESWWVNLLYLNNIWPKVDMVQPWCLGQTWYLANDMQFFVVSPLFIYLLWRKPTIGLVVSGVATIAATVAPMYVVYAKDFPLSPSFMGMNFEYMLDFYIVPWCRFQPYICGLIFGYLLHKMRNQPKLKLNEYSIIWIWAIMGAVGAEVIYGLYPYVEEFVQTQAIVGSLAARVAYNGLHRLAWSICVGWVILACTKGAAGPINTILSWPAWIPLARLSYCIYLVHMTVISYMESIITFPLTFTHALGVYWVLGILCFSIFVAFIFNMLFENPMAHMEKIFFASLGIGKFPPAMKPPTPSVTSK